MKNTKTLMTAMALVLTAGLLVGCTKGNAQGNSGADSTTYTIGISQFAEHSSLDNCRNGFIEGLAEEGFVEGQNLELMFSNAQADPGTASIISDNFVAKKVDLICGIATPSAMAAYNSCMNTEIPVVYSAISDPVEAGLANADGTSTGNISGTSDALPVQEQLKLIREILPDAKTIGILYTTSEVNSISTIETYKQYAPDYGFEIIASGISVPADLSLAATNLASKVDCFSNMTDNTVVAGLQTLLDAANNEGIAVFGSEEEQVRAGCLAAAGIDYLDLGRKTGRIAAKILKGEAKAADIPFETISQAGRYLNQVTADNLGITLAQELVDSALEVVIAP